MQREIYAFFSSTRSVTHLAWSPFHDGIGSPFWPGEPTAIIGSWANLSTKKPVEDFGYEIAPNQVNSVKVRQSEHAWVRLASAKEVDFF